MVALVEMQISYQFRVCERISQPSLVDKEGKLVLRPIQGDQLKQLESTLPELMDSDEFAGAANHGARDYFYFGTGKIGGSFKGEELVLLRTLPSLNGMTSMYLGDREGKDNGTTFATWEKDLVQVGNLIVIVMRTDSLFNCSWAPCQGEFFELNLTS